MPDGYALTSTILAAVSAVATVVAVYYARDTVRQTRLQRVEDGWRQVVADTVELRRAAEAVLRLQDVEKYQRDMVRKATSPEWVAREGGPQLFRTTVALAEAQKSLDEVARERLEHSVTGRYRTAGVLKLVKASAKDIARDAPAVIKEMRGIHVQDRLLRDPGFWFRNPTPWHQRVRIAANQAAHRWIILPAIRIGRRSLRLGP